MAKKKRKIIRYQPGGFINPDGVPNRFERDREDGLLNSIDETVQNILNIKNDKKGRETFFGIMQDLGYVYVDDPKGIKNAKKKPFQFYKDAFSLNVSPKKETADTPDPEALKRLAEQYKTFQLQGTNIKELQLGGDIKPPFEEFFKTINPEFADTTYYNLREAYSELPIEILNAWRKNPNKNHLPDTYKLFGHPSFSVESKYYRPGMKAGYWLKNKYIPLKEGETLPTKEEMAKKKKIINYQPGGSIPGPGGNYFHGSYNPQYVPPVFNYYPPGLTPPGVNPGTSGSYNNPNLGIGLPGPNDQQILDIVEENKKKNTPFDFSTLSGPIAEIMAGDRAQADYQGPDRFNPVRGFHGYNYQLGGNINTTGYTPGFSSFNNPENIIPLGKDKTITMKNTPFPVLAIPDVGEPVILKPGEVRKFKNASLVKEIPMGNVNKYQLGGLGGKAFFDALSEFQKSSTEVLRENGDPWEYQKVGGSWRTRKIGNKNWIKPTGLALAAIKNRYEPDSLSASEKKLVTNHYNKESKKDPVPGTAITNNSPGYPSPGVTFGVTDNYQGNLGPVGGIKPELMSTKQGSMAPGKNLFPFPMLGGPNEQMYYAPTLDEVVVKADRINSGENYDNRFEDISFPTKSAIDYTVTDSQGNVPASAGEMLTVVNRMSPLYANVLGQAIGAKAVSFLTPKGPWLPTKPPKGAPTNYDEFFNRPKPPAKYDDLFIYQQGGGVEDQGLFGVEEEDQFDMGSFLPFILDDPRNTFNGGKRNIVPIQTEKGEVIASPYGDIVTVGAKKLHKNLEDDEITDFSAEENYVFSDTKKMKLKKKNGSASVRNMRLADIELGHGPMYYEEGSLTKTPKKFTMGDMEPNKNVYSFADYAKNVAKKFPLTDRENDAFAKRAQVENKQSRTIYLQALKDLSEVNKGKNKNNNFRMGGSPRLNMPNILSKYSGFEDPFMNLTKVQDKSLDYMALPKFQDGGFNYNDDSKKNKRKQGNSWLDQAQDFYGQYFNEMAQPSLQGQAAFQTFGTLFQTPHRGTNEYLYGNQYYSRLNNLESGISRDIDSDRSYFEGLPARENSALRLGLSGGFEPNQLASIRGDAIRQSNEGISGLGRERRGYMDKFGSARLNATDMFAGRQNQQSAYLNDFRNNQTSALAGIGSNYLAGRSALQGQELAAKTQFQLGKTPGSGWTDFTDSLGKVLNTIANTASAFIPFTNPKNMNESQGRQMDGSYRYTGPEGPYSQGPPTDWYPGRYNSNPFSAPLRIDPYIPNRMPWDQYGH